jgi:hypothetical protein
VGSTPASCAGGTQCTTGGSCDATSGACAGGSNRPDGTVCDADSSACTSPDACQAGTCIAGGATCAADQNCNPSDGACTEKAVVISSAKTFPLSKVYNVASAGANESLVAGTGSFNPAVTVDGISVLAGGGLDAYLARYNLTTGLPVWAKGYGDSGDQLSQAASGPTQDGTIALIGRNGPAGVIGGVTNTRANEADFLLLVDASNGEVKTGSRSIYNGINGSLYAVATNPNQNLIAICGSVAPENAAETMDLVPGYTFMGGNADLLVAVFDTTGALRWAKAYGSSTGFNDETCNTVAVADDGTVWAVGKYNDELDLGNGTGALPSLPGTTAVRHMWLAHFDASGNTISRGVVGNGSGTASPGGNITPYDLKLDSAGDLVVGGGYTTTFPIGGLSNTGSTDAFVAKLHPDYTPVWGIKLGAVSGDQVNSLAITAGNSVVAVGHYAGTAGTNVSNGSAATLPGAVGSNQLFILNLDGATGATHSAGGYGDSQQQSATGVVVSGNRVQIIGGMGGTLDFDPVTPAPDPLELVAGTCGTKSCYPTFMTFADLQ